ncbi:MAG: hypothetical protein HUJ99_08575 [Bacteroidaceae bacterium]|nr:hypothetical protein [Bacteroidaceae bacterium]
MMKKWIKWSAMLLVALLGFSSCDSGSDTAEHKNVDDLIVMATKDVLTEFKNAELLGVEARLEYDENKNLTPMVPFMDFIAYFSVPDKGAGSTIMITYSKNWLMTWTYVKFPIVGAIPISNIQLSTTEALKKMYESEVPKPEYNALTIYKPGEPANTNAQFFFGSGSATHVFVDAVTGEVRTQL